MLRDGARPRRADPRLTRLVSLTLPQTAMAISVILVSGGILLLASAALDGLRPARGADIRLATLFRAAVPDADSLAQDDIVARLTVPPTVAHLLAPLAATDPARVSLTTRSWSDELFGDPPAIVTSERMAALGRLASALATRPSAMQIKVLGQLIALNDAIHDPSSRSIIEAIGALPRTTRDMLAKSTMLGQLLTAISGLSEVKAAALADSGLLQLLPDDPERLQLIESLPRLDLSTVRLVNALDKLADPALRQAVTYVVDQIQLGGPEALRLLTAYWRREPALISALATSPNPQTRNSHHGR